MNYWLVKSEPEVYSIDDLARDKTTYWDGVRNYQARNFMRDKMRPGDRVLFYHSNAEPSGIAGVAEVVKKGYPDPTAFDPKDHHYDPDSDPKNPAWYVVDLRFVKKLPRLLSLEELKGLEGLEKMPLLQRGQRLSVQPVSGAEWDIIMNYASRQTGDLGPKSAKAKRI
jgi:predicted RNA-binding protein with PUA-like domain